MHNLVKGEFKNRRQVIRAFLSIYLMTLPSVIRLTRISENALIKNWQSIIYKN